MAILKGDRQDVNERQKAFYETKRKNLITRSWSFVRNGILNKIRKTVGVQDQIYILHKIWMGDLSQKKVLDLGCYSGNFLSLYLASNSKEYIGIDLSETAVEKLRKAITDLPNARVEAIDFLSDSFKEKDFDLIYAYGVLHHFEDLEELTSRLDQKLKPGGEIISYDPLQTSIPIRFMRLLYRPFQSDKDWEWPFKKTSYYQFQKVFNIKERRAVLGKAKWFFVMSFLPMSASKKEALGKKWHQQDWEKSKNSDAVMFSCMHLTMLMQKKD
jgi:2-polyprenyl-3-methyl-5-hydroxy-6-metoxy-1,4-benzoquinol methylase